MFEHVFKANPEGINQYTYGAGKDAPKVKPVFKPRTKLTIQSAGEALLKQGIKLAPAKPGPGFEVRYSLTGKDGSSSVVTAKELSKMLVQKEDFPLPGRLSRFGDWS